MGPINSGCVFYSKSNSWNLVCSAEFDYAESRGLVIDFLVLVSISGIDQGFGFFSYGLLCLVSCGLIVVLDSWVKFDWLSSCVQELECVDSWWAINRVDTWLDRECSVGWVKECQLSISNCMETIGPELSWDCDCSILENYWILQTSVVKTQVCGLSHSPRGAGWPQNHSLCGG